MKERERLVVTGLVTLMLILWLGFLVHRSSRFAGSLWGGLLGVSGAVLLLVPLAYSVVKRISPLKRAVMRRASMQTLLTWHTYAGIVGAILGLLHTGHKFNSPLGIALTAMMLFVVLSGFAGRYLMDQSSQTVREKKEALTRLELIYRHAAGDWAARSEQADVFRPMAGILSRLAADFLLGRREANAGTMTAPLLALRLSGSMADLEYSIRMHETFKRWLAGWLKLHIVISLILYLLLGLHVWAGIYFGLRWLS